VPNPHPIIKDTLQTEAHMVYGDVYRHIAFYHHRRNPEMEQNKSLGLNLGYGYADRRQSAGVSLAFTSGNMIDKFDLRYGHTNFISRLSYAFDFHEGPWHGHIAKVQFGASRGFGHYQGLLEERSPFRTEFALAIPEKTWLYSFGYGMGFTYDFKAPHSLGSGLHFAHSTDFDGDGFRANFFALDFDYIYKEQYRLDVGGMLDARLLPRGETLYLGVGYMHNF
jgi:hypothetical protein